MTYTRQSLLSTNPNTDLQQCVKGRIQDLGLFHDKHKRKRGRRPGACAKNSSLPIDFDTLFNEESELINTYIPIRVTFRYVERKKKETVQFAILSLRQKQVLKRKCYFLSFKL